MDGAVLTVTIDRPEVRNAVDPETAAALRDAFHHVFEADASLSVAVLTGAGGTFCAGFDLKAMAAGEDYGDLDGPGPMGPTRFWMAKPVIAAIEGYAVAGGLELALWCDLRVAARDAVLGVFNRRFGVPLIDMGTVRLPRLVGQGRALDLVLTGRPVEADEALRIGLIDRVVEPGHALAEAQELARKIAAFPQAALRADRDGVIAHWGAGLEEGALDELQLGMRAMRSGEPMDGAKRFAEGEGRHGA